VIHINFLRHVFGDNHIKIHLLTRFKQTSVVLVLAMNHTCWFEMRRKMNFDVIIVEKMSQNIK